MPSAHEMLKYARENIGSTDKSDPIFLQLEEDGLSYYQDGWQLKGNIQPGERRIVRYIYGGSKVIIGGEDDDL